LEDYRGSIEDLNKSIILNPNDPEVILTRGSAKMNIQDNRGALEDCSKAILLKPDYAKAYYVRGLIKFILDQNSSGCQDLKKASNLGYTEADEIIKEYCR
jgi:regulator of sirC expression with transglutaminase-like and TPR domain